MNRVFTFIFISIFSPYCFGSYQTGTISEIIAHDDGAGFEKIDIKLSGTDSGV